VTVTAGSRQVDFNDEMMHIIYKFMSDLSEKIVQEAQLSQRGCVMLCVVE